MYRAKQNFYAEASSDSLHEQDHSKNGLSAGTMSWSQSVSVQAPQGQPVQEEDPPSLHKVQKQLNMQNTTIYTWIQATERFAHSKYNWSRTK